MNFNQLKIFHAVAKRKSFSLAAKDLFLTQPSISIQLRLLENYFGVRLIERTGKSIELTDAGEVLLSFAEKIFEISQEAENMMVDYRTLKQGTLRIHAPRVLAKCYMPNILNYFKTLYPNIKIILKSGNAKEAVDGILNFELDIAIVGRIHYDDKLKALPFFKDKFVLVCSPQQGFLKQNIIDFKELAGKPIIIREPGSGSRSLILDVFEKEGISPSIAMELNNSDVIKIMVEQGVGLAFMPYFMVRTEIEKGLLGVVEISNAELTRYYDIIFHKVRESSHLIKVFVNQAYKEPLGLKDLNQVFVE